MKAGILIGGLVVVGALVAVLYSGFGHDPRAIKSPLIHRTAPDFSLERVDGKGTLSLAQLEGKPAVINFWATWCDPCKEELPVLLQAARGAKGVQFVGIVYEDDPANIENALARHGGAAYPTLIDKGGHAAIAYGVAGVPETFFLDRTGHIVAKFPGPLEPDELQGYLAEIRGSGS